MPDHDDTLPVVPRDGVVEERARGFHHLSVALAAGKWLVDVAESPPHADLRRRAAVQLAVVAFPQTGVEVDWDAGPGEGDLGRLDRTTEIGGVNDVGVATALAE